MNTQFKYIIILLVACFFWFNACKKVKDPPPTTGDDRLTNPYCNDPHAVNYNWGFPGKPDNSICIYPVDTFIGTWQFLDSVFAVDSSFSNFQTKTLIFSASEDTTSTHLAIKGWCNTETLFAVADKFKHATVDTLAGEFKGQIICNQSDSISGSFNLNTYKKDTMSIELTIQNNVGTQFHRGWAIKQ